MLTDPWDADSHERPVVSVVMPFMNAERFIRTAADSVLSQSWAALDLVLVDDGGDDGSERIASEIAAADQRVRVVTHEGRRRRGTGPSRALGITEARGDLVAFLDADDVWEPHHLSDYVTLLRSHPEADMVCGRSWVWQSWSDPRARDYLSELAFAPGAVVSGLDLLAAVLRNGGYATPTCALLVRRGALVGSVGHVETFADLYEDQVINSWLQLRCTAVMSGATSAWYRMHPESISVLLQGDHPAKARLRFLTWLRMQLEAHGVADSQLLVVLGKALRDTEESLAPPPPPAHVRAVRAVLPDVALRQVAGMRRALRRLRATSCGIGRARMARALWRYGSDLRGEVLLLGDEAADSVHAPSATYLHVRPWPDRQLVPGPDHALATLASEAYDCVVLMPRAGALGRGDLGLRHLRRALRPSGVLLIVLLGWDEEVADSLRVVFGWDAVSGGEPNLSRPYGIPVVLRAVVPGR